VRIIGGRARGLHLAPVGVGDAAARLRPTSDRVREAIFNLLINGGYGDPVNGAQVLDLFAGTGALALESISRGAARAVLVDDGAAARALIQRNVALLQAGDAVTHLRRDATRLGTCPGHAADLVFLDPPYGRNLGEAALASALEGGWIASGALIVWEESQPPVVSPAFSLQDQRRYGDTLITILRAP
jgi:16S rRNA (guanine966-N2)-methyltransferase